MEKELERFVSAHQSSYKQALTEIQNGRKQSHWMWFIFPQLRELGRSETAKYYGIADLKEARTFLDHPILGKNLIEISKALLQLRTDDPHQIFGSPDDLKLRSSMTLFSSLASTNPVFQQVLDKFYDGKSDELTNSLIN